MQPYIILQYPYETIELALCNQGEIIQSITQHKFTATALTIPNIEKLLKQNNLQLQDIAFFGVNIGPGPYNTLRALLTMANGITYVTQTPLIGLSALDLLQQEHPNSNTLVMLHAFADHVFFQIKTTHGIQKGACSISEIITLINQKSEPLLALGNAAQLYKDLLKKETANLLIFDEPMPLFNSLQTLALASYEKFIKNDTNSTYLKPIYFEDFSSQL